MKWITSILLILCISVFAQTNNETRIMESYGKAVVMIAGYDQTSATIGQGSGFLVSQTGVIVTNYHVIKGAYPLAVKLTSGDIYNDILVIGFDDKRDIAIIKINGWNLPTVKLGNSDSVKIGQQVIVIGNPEGLSNTISSGLLSGIRPLNSQGYRLHQISAPISHGSSGSPVFNSNAEVIGIAVGSIESGQSLNFSIPINYVRGMISETPKMTLEDFAKMNGEITGSEGTGVQNLVTSHLQFLSQVNDCMVGLFRQYDTFMRGRSVLTAIFLVKEHLTQIERDCSSIRSDAPELDRFRLSLCSNIHNVLEGVSKVSRSLSRANWTDPEGIAKFEFGIQSVISSRVDYKKLVEQYDTLSTLRILPVMRMPRFDSELPKFGFRIKLGTFSSVEILSVDRIYPDQLTDYEPGDVITGVVNGPNFSDANEFLSFISGKKAGDSFLISIERLGKPRRSWLYLL